VELAVDSCAVVVFVLRHGWGPWIFV